MDADEDVDSMYTRFTEIVNTSKILGRTFSNSDLVRKNLRSLPPKFNPKESYDPNMIKDESLVP
ncbi:hypothetical protein KSP40_PGU017551 [Platanthera guangdongensis]|uniref:Uncharacterized protein n=1 Tax=Platanthera guangdongensis TaxID=2320717 RepID=A0ABR2MD89_9ASPA